MGAEDGSMVIQMLKIHFRKSITSVSSLLYRKFSANISTHAKDIEENASFWRSEQEKSFAQFTRILFLNKSTRAWFMVCVYFNFELAEG